MVTLYNRPSMIPPLRYTGRPLSSWNSFCFSGTLFSSSLREAVLMVLWETWRRLSRFRHIAVLGPFTSCRQQGQRKRKRHEAPPRSDRRRENGGRQRWGCGGQSRGGGDKGGSPGSAVARRVQSVTTQLFLASNFISSMDAECSI